MNQRISAGFVGPRDAELLEGPALSRARVNREYLMSLTAENLLRPYRMEAGLWRYSGSVGTTVGETAADGPENWHWGWESPTSDLRGHILGHWLSAAAYLSTHDEEVRARANHIVKELVRCQEANGGQWVAGIPRGFMDRVVQGQEVWAPQYTVHKILMGLWDMYAIGGNATALKLLTHFADWFVQWTGHLSREQLDDVLDVETGGMLEIWANLYGETGENKYSVLMSRYNRPRFFDRLLSGEDVLTNRHANTQIPEILGAARAWEVTGDRRWRDIVEAFWFQAVTSRGTYCTGGSTSGEVWQPSKIVLSRLHRVQEHCTVYNMMRLAQILYSWTGEKQYADYWERNLVNGIFAQQNHQTGMVTYFLSLAPGSEKQWGSRTNDFWCCHGTLLQAHSHHATASVQRDEDGLRISQYIPSDTHWDEIAGASVAIRIQQDPLDGVVFGQTETPRGLNAIQRLEPDLPAERPDRMVFDIEVRPDQRTRFTLRLRIPDWVRASIRVYCNGNELAYVEEEGWVLIDRDWSAGDLVRVEFPTQVRAIPAPETPGVVSFEDGPYVLAGLTSRRVPVKRARGGDATTILAPDETRTHHWWNAGTYRTIRTPDIQFVPLFDVTEGEYTVYFPVESGDDRSTRSFNE
ncbi:beta-L-arabinofuranosidase domain-containing protein [Paenarthrobacter nitroguajacolicus]|uniref:beta-L-arabinofuranosidase domain-containing protein n=1 Tax=Paenarthrobacter nitroguajacolicus TaxID=211146 RepID=UPI00286BA86D|nr:beta-L-arabinofuranosidase domain-containing protein [Paenarthrobacter nitroguajacolicus]